MLFSSVEVVRFARFVRFVGRYSASVIFITSIRLRIGRGKKCAKYCGAVEQCKYALNPH